MSGVIVVRALLAANAALIAQVPAAKIMAGVIPLNTVLPAISIAQISGVQRRQVKITATGNLITDRVQVTVMAATYPQQKAILALIRAALPNTRGTVNTISCDSILPDSDGPDFYDADISAYFQSTDFIVKFTR